MAVHATRAIYCHLSTEAVPLVDASNAFNCLNHQVSLHDRLNVPSCHHSYYTYRENIPLFIDMQHICSSEGTTQSDPLAKVMYSISVTPLIASLQVLV